MADKGAYIVMFKENTPESVIDDAVKKVEEQGGKIKHRYDSMKGFAASFPDNVLMTLEAHEHVDVIEADGVVSAYAKTKGI